MLNKFKQLFYFPVASYFRFFAAIRLRRWKPKIIVVTGSNGKTTLLHMLEAQLGEKAKFSHHANSAYGVPFDILQLHRKTFKQSEWLGLFLKAPLALFTPTPQEKIYIVEADADRPHEGKFLAELLQPEVVLWVSTGRTHSMNFDHLVSQGKFNTVEEAIAFEYGYFLDYCKKLAVIDADSALETGQVSRTKAKVIAIAKKEYLKKYTVGKDGTSYHIQDHEYVFNELLPQELYLSIAMCKEAVTYVGSDFDSKFTHFHSPPGRGSIFKGIKDTTIIDSTYNGNLGSIKAMLAMYSDYLAKKKWVVIGDMKELGKEEQAEHESLADLLNEMNLDRVILIGELVKKYTLPLIHNNVESVGFTTAPEAIQYIEKNIRGEEAILLKGSQSLYLEGLVEVLLNNKEDRGKLPRQEQFWKLQRVKLGFDSQ